MKNKTRVQYATLNSTVSTLIYFLKLLFLFVNRTIFIKILGIKILGFTNLVLSIIGVLSLAELGVGTAITYALYKPVADGDIGKRNAYLQLYSRIYKFVAIAILILGIVFFPFLKFFTTEDVYSFEFSSIYFLLLINSSIGYLMFAYKRSLLDAKQQKYIFVIWDFLVYVVFSVIRWIVLYLTGNYVIFLFLNIASTIVSNLVISYIANKGEDLKSEISKLDTEEKTSLKKNILGGFANQLATVIVFSTDNLLISKFLGIAEVGFYGNYTLIVNNLSIIMTQLTNSHTSTVGNLIATENDDRVENVFKKYNFLNFVLVYYCSLMVLGLVSPFIKIWLGEKFVLNNYIVWLVSIYLFLNSYRNSLFVFIGGYGLYWTQKAKAIAEALLNIIFSLVFLIVFKFGMAGILLGTICSNVCVNIWYEPYSLYKYGLKKPIGNYINLFFKQLVAYIISFLIISNINIEINGILGLAIYGIILSVIVFITITVFYFKTEEFKYFMNVLNKIFSKIIKIKKV